MLGLCGSPLAAQTREGALPSTFAGLLLFLVLRGPRPPGPLLANHADCLFPRLRSLIPYEKFPVRISGNRGHSPRNYAVFNLVERPRCRRFGEFPCIFP